MRPNKQPAQPLVLWGYDASPFVNLVKETLSELELPYTQVGKQATARVVVPSISHYVECCGWLDTHKGDQVVRLATAENYSAVCCNMLRASMVTSCHCVMLSCR